MKKLAMLKTVKFMLAVTTVASLVACGGGGSSSSGSGTTEVAANNTSTETNPLKKYEGTYYVCNLNGHSKANIKVSALGSNSMTLSYFESVYQNQNCTGNIVGTYTLPSPVTATYQYQTSANFPRVTIIPASDVVDRVTLSSPAMTAQLTGSGVSGSCVNYTNGNICFNNIVQPATTKTGAAYLNGNYFVTLSLLNGVLTADGIFSKDPLFNVNMLVPN